MRARHAARAAGLGITCLLAGAAPAAGEPLIGLSADPDGGNSLIRFDSATPSDVTGTPITGAPGAVVGIDVRPATGELYGLTATSRIVRINPATGAATPVGMAPFTPALAGGAFGFDFNPTVDRIRIVSDAEQDLRANPDTGAVAFVDGTLSYGMGGPNPDVTGAAYTNPVPTATMTTLYDIDVAQDQLAVQSPPNAGTLVPVGPLGVDAVGDVGFDISPRTGTAFAAITPAGTEGAGLFTVDLAGGAATPVDAIGGGRIDVIGLAAAPVCTITGTDGRDVLRGTVGDDVICGLLGDDTIDGVGGTDVILGGGGNDRLTGGSGVDQVFGGDGNDRVAGSGGADLLAGAGGADLLLGGSGGDVLRGAEGDDTIAGEHGADMADGGTGNDVVNGGGDDDMLAGGAGSDSIVGSGGDDAIVSDEARLPAPSPPGTADDVECGAGVDRVDADETDRLQACDSVS